jgi:hypothetical protein
MIPSNYFWKRQFWGMQARDIFEIAYSFVIEVDDVPPYFPLSRRTDRILDYFLSGSV